MLTIDASIWINAVSPLEPNHASSRALLDFVVETPGISVVVPTLVRVEIAASFSRTGKSAVKLRELYELLALAGVVRLVSLDDSLSKKAANLAGISRLRGADAVYAAVALEYDCYLVSLDREHITRLATMMNVFTPEQALDKIQRRMP